MMFRLQGEESALVLQSFLSLTSVRDPDLARGLAVKQENPLCKRCGGLTIHRRQGKISKFVCLTCEDGLGNQKGIQNKNATVQQTTSQGSGVDDEAPECPNGHGAMIYTEGPHSIFWGWVEFRNENCQEKVIIRWN